MSSKLWHYFDKKQDALSIFCVGICPLVKRSIHEINQIGFYYHQNIYVAKKPPKWNWAQIEI